MLVVSDDFLGALAGREEGEETFLVDLGFEIFVSFLGVVGLADVLLGVLLSLTASLTVEIFRPEDVVATLPTFFSMTLGAGDAADLLLVVTMGTMMIV